MVIQCAFTNCTNKPHSWAPQSFHKFPFRDPERTQLWLLAAGLDINTPAETLLKWRLCSDHFRPDDFAKPRNLKDHTLLTKSAVPSVFPDALSVLRQCIPTRTGQQGAELEEANCDFRIPRSGTPPNVIKAKCDTVLSQRTRALWGMVESSADGILDMNKAWQSLGVRMRNVLDIANILLGAGVLVRTSKHTWQSTGPDLEAKLDREVQTLKDTEKRLDELIETALEQVNHTCEDEISEKFLYLSYEDVKTIPSLREQTVIVVKAPAETVLEVPHPEESLQLFLKSSQGPIDVYLSSEDHSPFDVPEDPQDQEEEEDNNDNDDEEHTDCSSDDGLVEHTHTSSLRSRSSTEAVDDLCSSTVTMEHFPPLATKPLSPSPSPLTSLPAPLCSPEGEETPSFATLTTPLALSLGGEEYLLSLGEDEGISYPFSSTEFEGGLSKGFVWQCLPP